MTLLEIRELGLGRNEFIIAAGMADVACFE